MLLPDPFHNPQPMKFRDFFRKFRLHDRLKIKTPFLETEVIFEDVDRKAAWELYVELVTRVTTQPLDQVYGDEAAALTSVHTIFESTREVLRKNGVRCYQFSRIAVLMLNQVVRPFTTKWHEKSVSGELANADEQSRFRAELTALQEDLLNYTALLAEMAGVEDITDIEELD
jgi:hypothetical protein